MTSWQVLKKMLILRRKVWTLSVSLYKGGLMSNMEPLKRIRDIHTSKIKPELCIKNVKIVNTLTREIHPGNLVIDQGKILGFDEIEAEMTLDGQGRYVAPLLTDAHIHIESTMVTPMVLNDIFLPKGIGKIIADPHEIANVCGTTGIQYILDCASQCDLDVMVMLPSCVPSTRLEHAGAILKAADLQPFYTHPNVFGLAEVMDLEAVKHEDDMLIKIADAISNHRSIDGHGSLLNQSDLDLYASLQIRNDHECGKIEDMIDRLRRGITVFIREGSVIKNLKELLPAVNDKNAHQICFCTDDRHPDDIIKEGGVDYVVNLAIQLGLDPILAITMATLNPARHYKLENQGAIAPGYAADFFMFSDLNHIQAEEVYKNGRWIASNGTALHPKADIDFPVPEKVKFSVNCAEYQVSDIQCNMGEHNALKMIKIIPGGVITPLHIEKVEKNIFNQFIPSIEKDQAKLVVIERHHQTGNIGVSAVKGFGLTGGAIATTVAHDSHNIIAIGTNDFDIIMAIEQLRKNDGGYVVANDGKILAHLRLEIAGLMTNRRLTDLIEQMEVLHTKAGYFLKDKTFNPFLMLSFISLPVIPDVKLTDIGLIDVNTQKVINTLTDIVT
jgi:adenine deaminase